MTLPIQIQPLEPSPAASPLWTVDNVAAYLQLNPETVRVMARTGEIPSMKVGKRVWRFDPECIEAWLRASTETSHA